MGPLIRNGDRPRRLLAIFALTIGATYAQTLPVSGSCAVSAVPNMVRSEGLTERMGDILLQCSGSNPGAVISGNLTVFLPVNITNRVDANNQAQDAILAVDYGGGFVPTGISGQVANQMISFNGLNFTVPASGQLNLRISSLRAAAYQMGTTIPQQITARISFTLPLSIPSSQSGLAVAYTQPGLFATFYDRGNITCVGSPVPQTLSLSNLFTAGTAFSSTRLTEGFASAFQPRSGSDDTGTRFLVTYSGFPANAHLYVPDFVAGSSAAVPTSGGDLGLPQQVGQYVPGSNTLLLAHVQFANPDGTGGQPIGAIALNSVSEVSLTGGSGYVVYEVIDANPNVQESVQFPSFVGIANVTAPSVAQETVTFAPISTVTSASTTAPVPRFAAVAPASDCSAVGDCGASYFPKLSVLPGAPIMLTAIAGGAMTSQPGYIPIQNGGGGILNWTATVNYLQGSNWLTLDNLGGQNNGSVRVFANLKNLPPAGTYQANVVISAGVMAGVVTVPITLTVSPAPQLPSTSMPPTSTPPTATAPTTPSVVVSKVVNAATFDLTPLVSGSLGTVLGSNLAGKVVSVTFDGQAADLLYAGASQINLRVPSGFESKTSATLVVTVDGVSSAPMTVALAPAWPSLFAGGVLNQDSSVNAPGAGAKVGSILQIFATGIPAGALVSVQIGGHSNLVPLYSGEAPDVPGVQQVNVAVPDDASASTSPLVVCATAGGRQYCSAAYSLTIQ
jgi:uncharacterized protein (TIGR03437 family)